MNLAENIVQWKREYYDGNPTVSNDVYDEAIERLKRKDPNHPVLQMVGIIPSSNRQKMSHEFPMGSLASMNDLDQVVKWVKDRGMDDLSIEYKYDGLSVEAEYDVIDGVSQLISLSTRGDGTIGEIVTANAIMIDNLPITLKHPLACWVRGEVVLLKSVAKELGYKNPRNGAVGLLKRKDPIPQKSLTFFQWYIILKNKRQDERFKSYQQKVELMRRLGFRDVFVQFGSEAAVRGAYQEILDNRENLPFDIDGLVIKTSDLTRHNLFQMPEPDWALAIKFPSQSATTILKEVVWQVSRHGRINPVAIIEPINILGTTVQRATLKNISFIESLEIGIGDEVIIQRAGDVIPDIETVVFSAGKPLAIPYKCPECNSNTIREGPFLYCRNKRCTGQVFGAIKHWIKVLDIPKVSNKTIQKLIDAGLVSDIPDLYDLTIQKLLEVAGIGNVMAETIYEAISNSKKMPLSTLIQALNIPGISTVLSENIAIFFDSVDKLLSSDAKTLMYIDGIGKKTSQTIINSLVSDSVRFILIHELIGKGVEIVNESSIIVTEDQSNDLSGKLFCISGTLYIDGEHATRKQFEELIKAHGGKIANVSKKLDYLIVGENAGSKVDKANKLGIKIITDKELLSMIDDTTNDEIDNETDAPSKVTDIDTILDSWF